MLTVPARVSAPHHVHSLRCRSGWLGSAIMLLAVAVPVLTQAPTALAQAAFPFDQEMLLDVRPLPGSRRVPGRTIKVTLGPMREETCTPDRAQRDEELTAALAAVTQWSIEEDVVVLAGAMELRYRLSTH
jgi:hypothetical protein